MKSKRGKRVFTVNLKDAEERKERVLDHVAYLAELALGISVDLSRQELEGKGTKMLPEHLLVFIIAVMVSLEIEEEMDDVLQFSLERGKQFLAMSQLFWLLLELKKVTLPDGFPYTLEEMKAITPPPTAKGAN